MWKQHILVRISPPKQWTKGNRVALQSIGCPVRIRYVGFQISSFFCGYTYMQCMLVGKLVCCSMLMMSAYVMFAIVVGLQRRGEHETFPSLIFIYLFASGAMQFILLLFFFFFFGYVKKFGWFWRLYYALQRCMILEGLHAIHPEEWHAIALYCIYITLRMPRTNAIYTFKVVRNNF